MRCLVAVQARKNSTRFKNKIYEKFGDSTVLETIIATCKKVNPLPNAVECFVAVICSREDVVEASCDVFVSSCAADDLVCRYFDAMETYKADAIVRISADCPLVLTSMIEHAVIAITKFDYSTNCINRTFYDGNDVQAISKRGMLWINENQKNKREHPFIYLDKSLEVREKFLETMSINELICGDKTIVNPYLPDTKLSIDEPKDLDRCMEFYEKRRANNTIR